MNENFEKIYHQYEKNHFWFRARRKYIVDCLNKFPQDISILDIGCSSGILLNELMSCGFKQENLYGIDISEDAIEYCKDSQLKNVFVMDAQSPNLNRKFDVIVSSDCLEHLEQDVDALKRWYDLLKDGGILLIFVPAFKFLWSQHDVANMHYRRYTEKELKNKLTSSNFKIKKSSYWNFFLFPPILLIRLLSKIRSSKTKEEIGDLKEVKFNKLFFSVINFENKLLSHINFPWGVSVFAVAQK